MIRDKVARILADLAKVGDIEKCRTCHCCVDVLRQVREDILSRDGGPRRDDLPGIRELSHGCLGGDPCLPVEPFNAFNELLTKDRAQEACCPPASAEG